MINATGVLVHTNLGRVPLAREALDAVEAVAAGYSTLEYDTAAGRRGHRDKHVTDLCRALTGAEDALVVNNNAAALLLALGTSAGGREAIVSRGELVEIGGGFRIPEVVQQSGARLREVGTTNRTRIADYEAAIGDDTALLLKVHRSNFAIVGFTCDVDVASLAALAHGRGLPLVYDAGSGAMPAVSDLVGEPAVADHVAAGADLVTFSGDKLLGGPQAGIVVGRRAMVERLRRAPLYRALRPDKMTLAALHATLRLWRDAPEKLPLVQMLRATVAEIEARCRGVVDRVTTPAQTTAELDVVSTSARVGGGAAACARSREPCRPRPRCRCGAPRRAPAHGGAAPGRSHRGRGGDARPPIRPSRGRRKARRRARRRPLGPPMTRPSHAVIGTAGHVDHGKTSLVRALTGTNCDRLPEERRRGLTIDLGFARWDLPDRTVSVVDVPGHERFVQTMAAGAAGLDGVLLVVAADDGVMPQTREHLAICEELGVRAGVVVVTKADLADEEMGGLVAEEVRAMTRGTFLEEAPVVPCSVREGRGLEEVTRAVADALGSTVPLSCEGPPWLSIDRVFSKHGFGTVVTGTLVRGEVAVGDVLDVLPSADGPIHAVTVRGLSVHGGDVERAWATTRLALNLRGADRTWLGRGAVLCAPGAQRPTRVVDAEVRLFADAPALDRQTDLVLHVGTAHATVRARPLAPPGPAPGERGVLRLTSKTPFSTYAGQRFVLRRPDLGDHRTVAGGEVIDPHPEGGRRSKRRATPPSLLAEASLEERIGAMVDLSAGGITTRGLVSRLPPGSAADAVLSRLVGAEALVPVGSGDERRFFSRAHVIRARQAVLDALSRFHREHPAASGATVAELAGQLPPALRPLAAEASGRRSCVTDRSRGANTCSLPVHDSRLLCDRVAEAYQRAGLETGSDEAVREAAGLDARTFREVVADCCDRSVSPASPPGCTYTERWSNALRTRVLAHFEAHETLSPGDFKALTGLTRKTAIALLEWLDQHGVTRRRGPLRVRAS